MTQSIDGPTRCAGAATFRVAVAAALLAAAIPSARAQGWPAKPVRFVGGFPPGGTVDILQRSIGQKLVESWGQPFVVENRAGAGGTIASDIVAKSPPDGYTILLSTTASQSIAPNVFGRLPYNVERDLAPVTMVATVPLVLIVHPSLPVRTLPEFVAFARSRPGQLNYASTGAGAVPHLTTELFSSMVGIRMVHVPYKGASLAMSDLVSGQVPLMIDNAPTALPLVRTGRLRALAVTSAKRSAQAPELPTFAESGVRDFEVETSFGVMVPAGTPREIIEKLHGGVHRALGLPDVRERLVQQGMTIVPTTPEAYGEHIRADTARWGRVARSTGTRID